MKQLTQEEQAQFDEELQIERTLLLEVILVEIEKWLSFDECSYLVTETISIADLAVFHELVNAFQFCPFGNNQAEGNEDSITAGRRHFDEKEFPLLTAWMDDIETMQREGKLKGKK